MFLCVSGFQKIHYSSYFDIINFADKKQDSNLSETITNVWGCETFIVQESVNFIEKEFKRKYFCRDFKRHTSVQNKAVECYN